MFDFSISYWYGNHPYCQLHLENHCCHRLHNQPYFLLAANVAPGGLCIVTSFNPVSYSALFGFENTWESCLGWSLLESTFASIKILQTLRDSSFCPALGSFGGLEGLYGFSALIGSFVLVGGYRLFISVSANVPHGSGGSLYFSDSGERSSGRVCASSRSSLFLDRSFVATWVVNHRVKVLESSEIRIRHFRKWRAHIYE